MSNYFKNPEIISAYNFISPADQYFNIPEHQRPFSWKKNQTKRLIDDIVQDMGRRMTFTNNEGKIKFDGDIISFIGTVVCFEDTQHKTVHPYVINQTPRIVHVVIDGQQRLTMFMILSIILHNYIQIHKSDINESIWLKTRCDEISKDLALMFEHRKNNSGNDRRHIYYPRMIREFQDQWSTNQQRYDSPISLYVSHYGKYHRRRSNGEGTQKPFDYRNRQAIKDKLFRNAVKHATEEIERICKGEYNNFPDIEKILADSSDEKKNILRDLFRFKGHLPANAINLDMPEHQNIIRALLISTYLMHKVNFVSLVTTDEEYAFDIFDSLNTTGELLTAYETFRPEIIRAESRESGIANYERTQSSVHEKAISGYLNNPPEKVSQKNATSEMLISFALAESGENLTKDLHRQRTYLRKKYQDINIHKRRKFTRHLMHVSEVYKYLWHGKKTIAEIYNIDNISNAMQLEITHARFAMDFIKDAGHLMPVAIISRFYEAAKSRSGNSEEKILDLCKAIKANAAFFALWRSHRNTDGIDKRYRNMFVEGHEECLACFNRETGKAPSLLKLKQEFCRLLKEDGGNSNKKISSRESWIDRVKEFDIYDANLKVTKFILLIAAHDSIEDPDNRGYLKKGNLGVNPILNTINLWDNDEYKTIEHIIPQSSGLNIIDRLGNLTLLPNHANAIFSNKSWPKKKVLFSIIGAETPEKSRKFSQEAIQLGISENSINELKKLDYLPMAKAIGKLKDFSKSTHVDKRSVNLMKMAWPTLSKWLDFK